MKPSRPVDRQIWRASGVSDGMRMIPEETAIAVSYNGGTYAVMMATPQNIDDFALGFSLTEGLIDKPADLVSLDVIELEDGVEARMWVQDEVASVLSERRRHIAGPTGCGLCGIESLTEALRPVARVSGGIVMTAGQVAAALEALAPMQTLNIETRAVHAAAFWHPQRGMVAVREDVGRHNALDKLVGALARTDVAGGEGVLVLTSRVSVEMVQKAAVLGTSIMVCVSAPTTLAVRMAEEAGITLVAIARADGFEVFTHAHRIAGEVTHHVA